MSSLTIGPQKQETLVDRLFPRVASHDVIVVVSGAIATAVMAQIALPLPFTPVPLTGQTFAVLFLALALGPGRATAAQAVYVVGGLAGLPVYAGGEAGWRVIVGPTGGYLIGFLLASALVGYAARRGWARGASGVAGCFLAGTLVIYGVGAFGLSLAMRSSLIEAVRIGVLPFVVGDFIKAGLAASLVPRLWRVSEP